MDDNIRALVKAMALDAAKPLELLDLNDDCLRHLCGGMDIRTLLTVAATCRRTQVIAQDIFGWKFKNIDSIRYRRHANAYSSIRNISGPHIHENILSVFDWQTLRQVLIHFGEYFHRAEIQLADEHARDLQQLVHFHGNELHLVFQRSLHLSAKASVINLTPLFKRLSILCINMPYILECNLRLPFEECDQLTDLQIIGMDRDNLRRFLTTRFRQLRKFSFSQYPLARSDLDVFLARNPQLTSFSHCGWDAPVFYSFRQHVNLRHLQLHGMSGALGRIVGQMRLESLEFRWNGSSEEFETFVDEATVLHQTLQICQMNSMSINVLWPDFRRFIALRQLHCVANINSIDITFDAVVAHYHQLIACLPHLEVMDCSLLMNLNNDDEHEHRFRSGTLTIYTILTDSCFVKYQKRVDCQASS